MQVGILNSESESSIELELAHSFAKNGNHAVYNCFYWSLASKSTKQDSIFGLKWEIVQPSLWQDFFHPM